MIEDHLHCGEHSSIKVFDIAGKAFFSACSEIASLCRFEENKCKFCVRSIGKSSHPICPVKGSSKVDIVGFTRHLLCPETYQV